MNKKIKIHTKKQEKQSMKTALDILNKDFI